MLGTACICVDFFTLQGAGLDDIAALRDTYVGKTEASTFARLGSVMTWACLYCFAFALTYRAQLSRFSLLGYLMPIGGFFLVSVFSAGRQASFQIIIITVLILWLNHLRSPSTERKASSRAAVVFAIIVSGLMIAYMGYIAVVRNNGAISDDKVDVLTRVFDLRISPWFDSILTTLGAGIRTTVLEALVYFSCSLPLFSKFVGLTFAQHSFGAITFPFVFRQIESFTGISVVSAYMAKVDGMISAGVIGVGWETAISSYIQDFGVIGACTFLFAEGYYTAYAWRRALAGYGFHEALIAVVALAAVIYMPLLPAVSDTNLFFLWIFCAIAGRRNTWIRDALARVKNRNVSGSGI